jgi:hypothetical protein
MIFNLLLPIMCMHVLSWAHVAHTPRAVKRDRTVAAAPPKLYFEPCNSSSPLQGFQIANGTVQWLGGGMALCVTYDASAGYDAPLVLTVCESGSSAQAWAYEEAPTYSLLNPPGMCAGAGGVCLQWSGQEAGDCTFNPPVLGPGCRIGVWPASSPTTWNNQFSWNSTTGAVQAVWASASGPTPSGQCVSVMLPQVGL